MFKLYYTYYVLWYLCCDVCLIKFGGGGMGGGDEPSKVAKNTTIGATIFCPAICICDVMNKAGSMCGI